MKSLQLQEPVGETPKFTVSMDAGAPQLSLVDSSEAGVVALSYATGGTTDLETSMSVIIKLARAMGDNLSTDTLNEAVAYLHAQRPASIGEALSMAHAIGLWSHTMEAMQWLSRQDTLRSRGEAIKQLEQMSRITERVSRCLRGLPGNGPAPPQQHLHLHGAAAQVELEAYRTHQGEHTPLPVAQTDEVKRYDV